MTLRVAKIVITQVLALVKSFYPDAELEPLAERMAEDCTEELFSEYLGEAEPVANQILYEMDRT